MHEPFVSAIGRFAPWMMLTAVGCADSFSVGVADAASRVDVAAPDQGAPSVEYAFGVEGARLTVNPNNVLSCYVEWETTELATSYVEFGARVPGQTEPHYEYRTPAGELSKQHRVFVSGLYEGNWDLRAVSENAEGGLGVSIALPWTSKGLPGAIPRGELHTLDKGRASDEWILTQLGTGSPWVPSQSYAVMYDLEGRPRWYTSHPNGPATLATVVNNGTAVLIAAGSKPREVDMAGNVIWTSPAEPEGDYTWWDFVDGSWHHEFHKLPNGNYVVVRVRENNDESGMRTDYVEEMTPEGEVVWKFNTTPINDAIGTWCYGSAAEIDHAAGKAWYASRNGAIVAQIDYETQAVDWILGGKGTLAQSPTDWSWFSDPHAPVILGKNRVLLFDDSTTDVGRSRAVELEIDPAQGTAALVWEYPKAGNNDNVWYSPGGGNAQRLANGNTAIAALEGSRDGDVLDFERTRFMEVSPDGELVAYMSLPGASIMYRGYRVPAPQLEYLPQ